MQPWGALDKRPCCFDMFGVVDYLIAEMGCSRALMPTKVTSLMTLKRFTSKSFVSIGDVLDKVVQQHRPNTHQALVRLWELWDAAVGPEIAANARPAAFKGDLLLLHVSNSTWLHHLRFLENEMIQKVNQALGGEFVKRIKMKIGTI